LLHDTPVEFSSRVHAATTILVPIQSKGRPIGLLVVESTAPVVDRDQRDFLLTLANQSGLAIENANLYASTLQLSITDGLTGLYNYRHFCERLEIEISRSRRYNSPLGLLLIDIDRFKSFNDRFGHLLGDEVLKAVAQIIRSNTRDVDVVARYGGEEFCVILQEIGGEEIGAYAERLRAAVATVRVEVPGDARHGVTVSVGAAVSQSGDPDAHEFIRRADEGLYRAKEAGRDRVCVWGEGACGEEPAAQEKVT
jgi:diguanylate cyclase (GGDEF)-like protein